MRSYLLYIGGLIAKSCHDGAVARGIKNMNREEVRAACPATSGLSFILSPLRDQHVTANCSLSGPGVGAVILLLRHMWQQIGTVS